MLNLNDDWILSRCEGGTSRLPNPWIKPTLWKRPRPYSTNTAATSPAVMPAVTAAVPEGRAHEC